MIQATKLAMKHDGFSALYLFASALVPTFTMKRHNWLELLLPTVLTGIAWLSLSSATTAYISWLDRWHQGIISENVGSILAAAEMQHALWEMQLAAITAAALPLKDSQQPPASSGAGNFRVALARASSAAFTSEGVQLITAIQDKFRQYVQVLEHSRSPANRLVPAEEAARLAAEVAHLCDELAVINQRMIEQRTVERRSWSDKIVVTRLVVALLGPLLGVWLGYRMASRVQRRLNAIHVTLEGAASEFGQVLVEPRAKGGNFDAIDRQVRKVAGRLHQVLSDLADARREVHRNERLAAVGQLAAGVAHELRNPLTAVKLLVQTSAQKAPANGLEPERLAVVQEEIARMENTIQSLLDFARPSDPQRGVCDLQESLRRAVNLVQGRAHQENIRIALPEDRVPFWTMCDSEQVHQVFVNLLMNGIDAMPQGGTLTIAMQRITRGPENAPACEVAFMDAGAGIPAHLLDRIFEPFVTTKTRGTGLGLAISRRLVEEHGGRLTAANRAEKGAQFIVTLPCTSPEKQRVPAARDGSASL